MMNKIKIRKNTADKILEQLGGNRFVATSGARNINKIKNGLDAGFSFFIPGQKGLLPNHIEITLTHNDTYDVNFYRFKLKKGLIGLGVAKDVFAEQLVETIEKKTNLKLCLKKRI